MMKDDRCQIYSPAAKQCDYFRILSDGSYMSVLL